MAAPLTLHPDPLLYTRISRRHVYVHVDIRVSSPLTGILRTLLTVWAKEGVDCWPELLVDELLLRVAAPASSLVRVTPGRSDMPPRNCAYRLRRNRGVRTWGRVSGSMRGTVMQYAVASSLSLQYLPPSLSSQSRSNGHPHRATTLTRSHVLKHTGEHGPDRDATT